MSLIHELIAAFEAAGDHQKAAQLRSELVSAGGAPPVPPKPPTLLDDLREAGYDALDALGISVSQVPAGHEIPTLLAVLVEDYDRFKRDVTAALDKTSPAPAEQPEVPASPPSGAGQTTSQGSGAGGWPPAAPGGAA